MDGAEAGQIKDRLGSQIGSQPRAARASNNDILPNLGSRYPCTIQQTERNEVPGRAVPYTRQEERDEVANER